MTERYYETSLQFKWGIAAYSDFLAQTMLWIQKHDATLLFKLHLTYDFERITYTYSSIEGVFVRSASEQKNYFSTPTNFVLQVDDRDAFDRLVAIGNRELVEFKQVLLEPLEDTEDALKEHAIEELIFIVFHLSPEWKNTNTLVIEDPSPQKVNESKAFLV